MDNSKNRYRLNLKTQAYQNYFNNHTIKSRLITDTTKSGIYSHQAGTPDQQEMKLNISSSTPRTHRTLTFQGDNVRQSVVHNSGRQKIIMRVQPANDNEKMKILEVLKQGLPFNGPSRLKRYCEIVLMTYLKELMKIAENLLLEHDDPIAAGISFCEQNLLAYRQIAELNLQLHTNIPNRLVMQELAQKVITVSQLTKNFSFPMYCFYYMAKVLWFYRNPIQCIMYFKGCKRFTHFDETFKMRMKSYKGLGLGFMKLRPKLSLLYLTKYLMSSWKLDDRQSEYKAYDLLGKYYYYLGEIQIAQRYHQKMTQGHEENPNSQVRRLAIMKFTQSLLFHHDNRKDLDHLLNQEDPEFVVSSDEEVFDVTFNTTKLKAEEVVDIFSLEKKQYQKYALRIMPKFDTNDGNRREKEMRAANKYIRSPTKEQNKSQLLTQKGEIDFSKFKLSQSKSTIGSMKNQIFVQHLSPNRALAQYQELELTKDSQSYKRVDRLNTYIELSDRVKIVKSLKKFQAITYYLINWLDQLKILIKYSSDPQEMLKRLNVVNVQFKSMELPGKFLM